MNIQIKRACACVAGVSLALTLVACGGSGESSGGSSSGQPVATKSDTTSGAAFDPAKSVEPIKFNSKGAVTENDGTIDLSSVSNGVVLARAKNSSRLKFVVICGEMTYNYDLPGDNTPITCPINMGDGSYTFAIMRNTGDKNYVQTTVATQDVKLDTEFAPFVHPNLFCNYTNDSACVKKARELTSDVENVGEAVQAVCTYIVDNVVYDTDKARELGTVTGYVPDPDETFTTNKGICFDYASLGAAMLRCVGIPTKVITGYVTPKDLYHAWIMVYIDGSWTSVKFSVDPRSWSRVDLTFGSDSSSEEFVGNGTSYTERYVF
ncbi:MAG: transglutaminase domain-containing protein [Atopobiaceae bacterium]|nr:transglutaminase domain-containing protein [Atopobiaceae bacterium]